MIGKVVLCKLYYRCSGLYCKYNSYLNKQFKGRISILILYIRTSTYRILNRELREKSVYILLISKNNVYMGFELIYKKINSYIRNIYEEVLSFMVLYFLESIFILVLVKYILY